MEEDPLVAKTVAMVCLFLASFLLGTLPIKLSEWFSWRSGTKNHIFVHLLLSVAGGVLLCTTFLHLLPEVNEALNRIPNPPNLRLPIAELLMCIGFFAMFFVEECVHHCLKQAEFRPVRNTVRISRTDLPETSIELDNDQENDMHYHHIRAAATLRGLLVVLALSVHELFEGLAVGLETSATAVWYMFGAVSAHKIVIAFCIGVELVTSGMTPMWIMVYVLVFAIVSPMGIGIGMVVSGSDVVDVPSVILQGLASGTLLYIVFFEILRTSGEKIGLKQYFAVFIGFVVMTGITLIQNK